jgi:hypothetical protein
MSGTRPVNCTPAVVPQRFASAASPRPTTVKRASGTWCRTSGHTSERKKSTASAFGGQSSVPRNSTCGASVNCSIGATPATSTGIGTDTTGTRAPASSAMSSRSMSLTVKISELFAYIARS